MDKNQMMEQLRDYVDDTTDMTAQEFLMEMPEELSIWLEENLMADMVEAVREADYEMEYITQVGTGSVDLYDENGDVCVTIDYEDETEMLRSLLAEGKSYEDTVKELAEWYVEAAQVEEEENEYEEFRDRILKSLEDEE